MFRAVLAALIFPIAIIVAAGGGRPLAAAPIPKHLMKEAEGDKAKFQGKWKAESLQMGNQNLAGILGQNFEFIIDFQGDKVIATANIQGMAQKTTSIVKYDAAKKQVCMTETKTVDANGTLVDAPERDSPMGYAFDGEKLILASNSNGKEAGDPLKPGDNDIVMVLVRVK